MTTFTSNLPDEVLSQLNIMANKLAIPKNKIIEKTLKTDLDQLARAEYVQSYRQAADDLNIIEMAEEGMAEYLNQSVF
ncbi:MAG: CopG family transcriptional regulator [Mariniphaga sp.]|nr:CopG family transcriptional regulator [Mariniphaga sp.]